MRATVVSGAPPGSPPAYKDGPPPALAPLLVVTPFGWSWGYGYGFGWGHPWRRYFY